MTEIDNVRRRRADRLWSRPRRAHDQLMTRRKDDSEFNRREVIAGLAASVVIGIDKA